MKQLDNKQGEINMGISGCTSCQLGSVEALRAYDQAYQVKRSSETTEVSKAQEAKQANEAQQVSRTQASFENRPIAGGTVGSIINISA